MNEMFNTKKEKSMFIMIKLQDNLSERINCIYQRE